MNRNESSGTQVENGFDCPGVGVGEDECEDEGDGDGARERDGEDDAGERGNVDDKGDGVVHPPLGLSGNELIHQLYLTSSKRLTYLSSSISISVIDRDGEGEMGVEELDLDTLNWSSFDGKPLLCAGRGRSISGREGSENDNWRFP